MTSNGSTVSWQTPGGGAGGGWTDGGTLVYLTTSTDNVGIGTSNPSRNLEISGSTNGQLLVSGSSGTDFNASDATINDGNGGLLFHSAAVAGVGHMCRIIATGKESGNFPSYLSFFTAASGTAAPLERLTITSSGYIGIGTSGPAAPLTLRSARNGSGSSVSGLRFENPDNANHWNMYMSSADEFYMSYGGALKMYVSAGGTAWNSYSDERLKKNISNLTYGLNEIIALRPVSFNFIDTTTVDKINLGFIAQDVKKIMPELVNLSASGYLGLDYSSFTPVLTKAVQEQQKMILSQKTEIEALRNKMIFLEKDNDLLNKKIEIIEAKIRNIR